MTYAHSIAKPAWQPRFITLSLLAICSTLGCGEVVDGEEPEATSELAAALKDPIAAARGLPAAIGAVGRIADVNRLGDAFSPDCTGVLIGPQTILTSVRSSFCVPTSEYPSGFGIGANGRAPRRVLEVVDGELVPKHESPSNGPYPPPDSLAVVYLKDPVTDIAPLKLGTLATKQVGKTFRDAGYHYELVDGTDILDVRRELRTVTLEGVSGAIYPIIFDGNFRAFRKWWRDTCGLDRSQLSGFDKYLRPYYDGTGTDPLGNSYGALAVLDPGYKVLALRSSHEPASYGELSTSDMLIGRDSSGGYEVYGVALESPLAPVGIYVIYETLGPEIRAFLERAISWKDPCAKRRQAGAYCDGDTARVCGADHKTQRSHNCASFDSTCVMTNGEPTCQW